MYFSSDEIQKCHCHRQNFFYEALPSVAALFVTVCNKVHVTNGNKGLLHKVTKHGYRV